MTSEQQLPTVQEQPYNELAAKELFPPSIACNDVVSGELRIVSPSPSPFPSPSHPSHEHASSLRSIGDPTSGRPASPQCEPFNYHENGPRDHQLPDIVTNSSGQDKSASSLDKVRTDDEVKQGHVFNNEVKSLSMPLSSDEIEQGYVFVHDEDNCLVSV